jgi:acyl carrier protein
MIATENRAAILQRIQGIVRHVLSRSDIMLSERTTSRDVLGWDSLAHLQIILSVESEFGLRISAKEVARLENAGSLVDIVLARATV